MVAFYNGSRLRDDARRSSCRAHLGEGARALPRSVRSISLLLALGSSLSTIMAGCDGSDPRTSSGAGHQPHRSQRCQRTARRQRCLHGQRARRLDQPVRP